MNSAFISSTPLRSTSLIPSATSTSSKCPYEESNSNLALVPTTITMRCRRDLKKEKSLRNLEFARAHRKKVVRRFNYRAAQKAIQDEDNEYLSTLFGTLRFNNTNENSK